MRRISKISLLLLVAAFLCATSSYADVDKDKDKDKDKGKNNASRNEFVRSAGKGGSVGACSLGSASVDLDQNNVRARLFNNGHLFWKGSGNVYTVPKTGKANSIFASGIWIGGLVGNELRFAGTAYGPFEFWPGPLDEAGNPPADCTPYDHIYSVTRADLDLYTATGQATGDITNWPWQLGAPVADGDGNPNNYNLAGGDRPGIIGEQTAWWVMNDAGGSKEWSKTAPMNLEVQVTAFAFRTADALNNTTFYKYKLIYKGDQPLRDTYFGIWSDPDLGDAVSDYVASDTIRGIGYVYNGTEVDAGTDGYGDKPPALGYDFFQGPLVNNDGIDNDRDGIVDETNTPGVDDDGDGEVDEFDEDERLQMSKFVYYNNDGSEQGNPDGASDDPYNYLRGIWRDGTPMTFGGTGYGGDTPTNYMFPGDPVAGAYWSEENTDGTGKANTPADRRFLMSAGPFTMQPGDVQEIVYGIVWAQGADRLASVSAMRNADELAQAAFNVDFDLPSAPDAPRVAASSFDNTIILKWENTPTSNNYLDSYDVLNPFLADLPDDEVPDKTYTFEGYKIYQYASAQDQEGTLIATYDAVNEVTTVTDVAFDEDTGTPITVVSARGSDSGIQHSMSFENLTNYQDYHFGVQGYAYNAFSAPKVYNGPITRVSITPTRVGARNGGTDIAEEALNEALEGERTAGKGGGIVTVKVVDPTALTGHKYEVKFYEVVDNSDPEHPHAMTTYDIVDATTGEVKLDGQAYFDRLHKAMPQRNDVAVVDGLSFTVVGPEAGPLVLDGSEMFVEHAGPGAGYACGPEAGSTFGCDLVGGNFVYGSYNGNGEYIMYHNGAGPEEVIGGYAPNDFEIRFTEEGSYAQWIFQDPWNVAWVPFEVWDIGPTGPFGENDPSDDVQMVAAPYADSGVDGTCAFGAGEAGGQFSGLETWTITDRIYAYYPTGDDYSAWEAAAKALVDADPDGCAPVTAEADAFIDYGRGRPLQRLVFNMNPAAAQPYPAPGVVVRFYTTKPHLPGDVYAVTTEGLGVVQDDQAIAESTIESIGVVPNPYKGASAYEVDVTRDEVRFTNLPEQARIRVYSLSGTLIWDEIRGSGNNKWDLKTSEGLPIASGMYLIHVEVPGVGEKVIKFGVIKKRIQLDLL